MCRFLPLCATHVGALCVRQDCSAPQARKPGKGACIEELYGQQRGRTTSQHLIHEPLVHGAPWNTHKPLRKPNHSAFEPDHAAPGSQGGFSSLAPELLFFPAAAAAHAKMDEDEDDDEEEEDEEEEDEDEEEEVAKPATKATAKSKPADEEDEEDEEEEDEEEEDEEEEEVC